MSGWELAPLAGSRQELQCKETLGVNSRKLIVLSLKPSFYYTGTVTNARC